MNNNIARKTAGVKTAPQTGTNRSQRRNLYLVPALADYTPSTAMTDAGNATRLLERHGTSMHYVPAWKCWMVWNGSKWEKDELGRAWLLAEDTLKKLYTSAGETDDGTERKVLAKFALACESEKKLKSMLSIAQNRPGIPVSTEELDADQMLFNADNGTINLTLGTFKAADPDDLCTKQTNVEYNPRAECPAWTSFLDKILGGNQALISFMQRAIGYAMTGLTTEQSLFILHGNGGNGKSTLIDVIMKLFGEYAINTPASTLLAKKSDAPTYDLARLKGVRFVSASETNEQDKMAESTVKSLTGDKTITARLLYSNPFSFSPLCKIFLATNNKPIIQGKDYGIWRRVKLVPFTVTIPEEEKDLQLYDKLLDELPGILNWAIAGCLAWQQEGLNPPDEVLQATQEYQNEMDSFSQFIDEECIIAANASCTAKEIYARYCQWCDDNGEKPDSQKRFGTTLLKKKGIDKYKSGVYYYSGIRPRNDDDNQPTPPPPTPPTPEKITRVGSPDERRGPLDDLDDQSQSRSGIEISETSLGSSVQMVQSSNFSGFEAGQPVMTPEGRGQIVRITSLGVYISVGGSTRRYSTGAQIARIEVLQE